MEYITHLHKQAMYKQGRDAFQAPGLCLYRVCKSPWGASIVSQVFYSPKPDTLPYLPLFCLLGKYKELSICIINRSLSELVDVSSAIGVTCTKGSGLPSGRYRTC